MPAVKTKRISTLIESQLPEFISTEYELFGKFVKKYYESQEVQGGTLDLINNIQKYADIDFYEQNLLKQTDILVSSVGDSDTTIVLEDASSFPEKNGYVRIEDEIIFYQTRTDTELQLCARGVSGNTTLGDLYDSSNFAGTDASSHVAGKTVYNVSNLFLYAFVKNFENQYLGSFPEKYLKGDVDKRTLIKNIQKFYKAKGTTSSIKFIFNTIVTKDIDNKPEVYNPRDFTYKVSEADWINVFALKCKIVSGDPRNLIGKKVIQTPTDEYGYSSATVDNVYAAGKFDGEQIWNIVLAPETVNGEFAVSTKTRLERPLSSTSSTGDKIDVFSTTGWSPFEKVLIGSEIIEFGNKNINQFFITNRGNTPLSYDTGEFVYKPATILSDDVTLLTLGVVYNLTTEENAPYSSAGDTIQVSEPGFQTADTRINLTGTNQTRWFLNNWQPVSSPTNTSVQSSLEGVPTNVSAILADDQYYYITSSGFPSYNILDRSIVTEDVRDQNLLRILRKNPTSTTEVYKTPQSEVGILLNGVRLFSYKDADSIRFGKLQSIRVDNRGRNYNKEPFVLIDGVAGKARSVLTGSVVDSIIIDTNDTYLSTPEIEITSGRGATARAVVTGGKVTSIIVEDAGKFYSSPPRVVVRDRLGRGRFAEYTATIDTTGSVTGFDQISSGTLYSQKNVEVLIFAVGEGAEATPLLKKWIKNKFAKYESELDSQYGYVFENYAPLKYAYGYGQLANPKALRVQLNDNLNSADTEPTVKTHSPIIGFAYDGNPIYGPFGHQDPLDSSSSITRMTSSYSSAGLREDGPAIRDYPLGSFIDDYRYIHRSGSLDENNGRFCITPDFPEGTYAYFITIDSNQVPKFPYILGDNFYSLPVDSNYNSPINQEDVPKNAKRLFAPGMPSNGEGLVAKISEVQSGSIDGFLINRSSDNFSVNCSIDFDNAETEGSEVEALVSSVKGKSVSYLQSKENKVVKLTTIQNAYLFTDDILRQPASNASGQIVGTVAGDNIIVLKNVVGTFNNTGTFSADIKTFQVTVDQDSNYTKGAELRLTDGVNPPIARAEILEGTSRQNTVKIKVTEGNWIVDDDYFLQSNNLFNTSGSKIVTLVSLSDNLEPFEVNQSIALIETDSDHGLGIDDEVDISIFPDDSTKVKNYFIRKRLYQEVTFRAPKNSSVVEYTGVGRFTILNGGADYAPNVYNNIPLTGGTGSGATATITVSGAGIVNSVQIQDGGSGYRRGDYLGVEDDQLARSGGSLSSSRLAVYVDHAGVGSSSVAMRLKTAKGFAVGDLLNVGSEIVRVGAINDNSLTIERAQEGTESVDIYDGQEVSLYKARYNFTPDYRISTNAGSGYIRTYDSDTQKATIVFDYVIDRRNVEALSVATAFFDSSTPERLVTVSAFSSIEYKFEISEDNVSFVPNPNIDIQEYYKYVFDTSHSSLTGTYFDMSPSKSFNLITLEKTASLILPGNPGAFTEVKFGFGSRLAQNNYDIKKGTNFLNFYYFDKNGIVDADGAYLAIINDPLQGRKKVNYVTPNRFVYDIPATPLWDGSGDITYTTKGQFAVGEINEISIVNSGSNYKKLPLVQGISPSESYRGTATVLFDEATKVITSVKIDNFGSNYVNPIAIITDGDGVGARFKVVQVEGRLFSINVENPGRGYNYAPTIKIVESDLEIYVSGSKIGIPRGITIIDNGGSYHLDKTISSQVSSQYTVSLTNFSGNFKKGELVTQVIDGVEVLRARVSEYRKKTNLLKLESTTGIIRENVLISGKISRAQGTVKSIFVSTFTENISSFFDNLGYFQSDKGKLGVSNQKLTDSFFYQDYSYVVKSKTSIEQWRDLIKSTTHPAGFKLFGQVDVETSAKTEMPSAGNKKADAFTTIQLWDPNKNKITVESTRRVVTQTIQKLENTRIRKGQGSAATSEFNFNETRAFTFTLSTPFDGYFDTDGRLQGTTIFQVLDDFGRPFNPISAESLIVTLDGIIQEPGVAYTVTSDKIIFAAPPLGANTKLTGQGSSDLTPYKGTRFLGRSFYFRNDQYNSRYIRKIRNIFQRNGRWIDAANQIERNKQFIIEESIGYGKGSYGSLDWSTKLDDYQIDIGYILDSYSHDLRFGGNTKVFDYANLFVSGSDYITNNKTESLSIFKYATNLAKLAIRNWDYVEESVQYIQGSKTVTVSSTDNLAVGMYISSGRAFSSDTKIVSIDSQTTVTLSKAALTNSGGAGGAAAGVTNLDGNTGGQNVSLPTSVGAVLPNDQFAVNPGDTLYVPISFSGVDSATFYLSGINNGTFYDAGNLIAGNKLFLQEEVSEYVYANYALPSSDKAKCYRDLGFLIDNIVYHLKFGGNERVVNFAQLYYTNRGYPYGEELTYINRSTEETTAAIAAWDKLAVLMNSAMRNDLNAGTYTSIAPYTDPNVYSDSQFPYCQEVESSINTFIGIVKDIIENGSGTVESVKQNENKFGYWSTIPSYSNYNIIGDPLLTAEECSDVISSVNSLYQNLDDVLNLKNIDKSLPDFIDGETKEFDLFWDNGDEVIIEEDERLLLTINAVLQQTKYNESYPGEDSYYIERGVVPNKLVFDVAPIWDQYEGAKTLGEATAVEKVSGVGVGNYKRLTIDSFLVNNVRTGPFLVLDLEDLTVVNVEQPDFLLVFIDGVLQEEEVSYTVSGPNIFFKFPITEQMKVDMRYLYGRDVGQILTIFDYNPDAYYTKSTLSLITTSGLPQFVNKSWMGSKAGSPIQLFQLNQDNTRSIIGTVLDYNITGNILKVRCFGNAAELIQGSDVYVCVVGAYDTIYTIINLDSTGSTIEYERDEDNRLLLSGLDQIWRGTFFRRWYRNPFISLSNGSKIKVEGENNFRRIKELPSILTSKEQRAQKQVSNSYFGQVNIESYNGDVRGEGLSIITKIENGVVVALEWNQRSYDPITQPTAYQYFTPPVIHFIPQDENGGGARAQVLVSKGQVISVELLDGGSGYTKSPKVVVARKYDVIEETDIGVSVINISINSEPVTFTTIGSSQVSILGNQVSGINTFTSIVFNSPTDTDRVITAQIQLVEECSEDLSAGLVRPILKIDDQFDDVTIPFITTHAGTEVSVYIDTPAELLNIYSESRTLQLGAQRQITQKIQKILPNDALSNINYFEVAAFLDVDLEAVDKIVYIPDTSKFKTNGYLLVGNEVIRYYRKLNDRFLNIERGENNTTPQFWSAGTYLRQIPDPVSVAFSGVSIVESESQIVTIKSGAEDAITERETERQIILPNVTPVSTTRVIELELQPQLNVESIISIESRILYKVEPSLDVQSFETTHRQTVVQGQLLKQIENYYTFDITQTILDVAVNPQVLSNSLVTVLTEVSSLVAREPEITAFSTLEHKETLVRAELLKHLTANTFTVSETIVNVAVKPQVASTSYVTILSDLVSLVILEPEITAFSTLEHKETYVRKYRDQFDALLGVINFNFDVTQTVVNVAVSPTAVSTTSISILCDAISVTPSETVTVLDSINYTESTIGGELQLITSKFEITKNQLEVLLLTPPSGVVDGYQENIFISDPIDTRLNGFVDILDDYDVVQRNSNVVDVINTPFLQSSNYVGSYIFGNVGHTIGHFEGIFDDGFSRASGLTIQEISLYYPTLALRDFSERGDSSYTLSGKKFILMPPSIQNPVAISSSSGTIGGSIILQNSGEVDAEPTKYFPDSGYLFTSSGTVIQYTGKTLTTFTGCSLYNGPNSINNSDEIIPYTIS